MPVPRFAIEVDRPWHLIDLGARANTIPVETGFAVVTLSVFMLAQGSYEAAVVSRC